MSDGASVQCERGATAARGTTAIAFLGVKRLLESWTVLVGEVEATLEFVRRAWLLPIDDLNYETSSEALGIYGYRPMKRLRRGVGPNMVVFIFKLLRALFEWRPFDASIGSGARVLVVVSSINQQRAVEAIVEHLRDVQVIVLDRQASGRRYPEFGAYVFSLPFLPMALAHALRAVGYARIGYAQAFDDYWLTYGYYVALSRLLARTKPELVIVANDHSMRSRTLMRAARDLGVATAYVPHASVSHGFPPLSVDVAFLEGIDTAEKYDMLGATETTTRVFLTGIARADTARASARLRGEIDTVGVCVNKLDPTQAVQRFVRELTSRTPNRTIIIRPHPSDARDWAALLSLPTSNSRIEAPFDFLDRVDAIVTGPSNIALEAALVNVLPLFIDFAENDRDHYGFVRRGLCRKVATADEVVEILDGTRSWVPPRDALRAYCATVDTPHDGRSAELVAELVAQILGDGIDLSRWQRLPTIGHLAAFELSTAGVSRPPDG